MKSMNRFKLCKMIDGFLQSKCFELILFLFVVIALFKENYMLLNLSLTAILLSAIYSLKISIKKVKNEIRTLKLGNK